jgi:hypothetical protein
MSATASSQGGAILWESRHNSQKRTLVTLVSHQDRHIRLRTILKLSLGYDP